LSSCPLCFFISFLLPPYLHYILLSFHIYIFSPFLFYFPLFIFFILFLLTHFFLTASVV
jgi:hypothetical protein